MTWLHKQLGIYCLPKACYTPMISSCPHTTCMYTQTHIHTHTQTHTLYIHGTSLILIPLGQKKVISEVSWFQGLNCTQTLHLGQLKVSCLLSCPHFRESWLESSNVYLTSHRTNQHLVKQVYWVVPNITHSGHLVRFSSSLWRIREVVA